MKLRFAKVSFSDRTSELVSLQPHGEALVELNRRLLEEAYHEEIERSWEFCYTDIQNPKALARRLFAHADQISLYTWERLSEKARMLIQNADKYEGDVVGSTLAAEFNRIAAGECIYDEERFRKVFTTEATIGLLEKSLRGEKLGRVNTYLLEDAFIWEVVKNRRAEVYLPWQMVLYLSGGLVAGIIVSLLTKPVSEDKLERFYALIRTPVQPGEKVTAPCTLPVGAVVPAKRNFFPKSSLEIPIPSFLSVAGFAVGWACVAAIIYAVYLIAGA